MSVGRRCSRVVATAVSGENIRTAAQRMADYEVGTLVVVGRQGEAVGVLTDRDIALRCVAGRFDPGETPIAELMSTPVHSVPEYTPLEDAVSRMADLAVRRLVVTGDDGRVVGILSLDDLVELLAEQAAGIARLLKQQKPGILA